MISKAVFASRVSWMLYPIYERTLARPVRNLFFSDLIRHTNYFHNIEWMGNQVYQNVLDLWVTAETIGAIRPHLIIECGSYQGGSALYYASMCDLLGVGRVITIDVLKLHDHTHPRVEFWIGDSTWESVVNRASAAARDASGPVMVILDSDHHASHVAREMEAYAPLVTPGSYLLVQDGVIDALGIFNHRRPGPLVAIRKFLAAHPEFRIDEERCNRFLITHHPSGWLKRVALRGSHSGGSENLLSA